MPSCYDVYRYLVDLIPSSQSEEWDNDGLMIASAAECKKILITLDPTAAAIRYAAENSFNAVVTHHPLIFRPLKNIADDRVIKAVKNDIAVMSFHTRLDANSPGVNDALAAKLGLADVEISGMLRVGHIEKCSLDSFANSVKAALKSHAVTYSGIGEVTRVAVLGGSGGDFIEDAIKSGADTFVTGECGYNTLCDAADAGLNVICAGHYHTEAPVLSILRDFITAAFPKTDCEIYESYPLKVI
jgi:dinuclear metal center YbgI/SA1388 family protein